MSDMYVETYDTYVYKYNHAYIHTYIHACINTNTYSTYIVDDKYKYIQYIHTCMHGWTNTNTYSTYITQRTQGCFLERLYVYL